MSTNKRHCRDQSDGVPRRNIQSNIDPQEVPVSVSSTHSVTLFKLVTGMEMAHRSRAVQISMNVSALEEWIGNMELPRGIGSHFAPVKDLLNWLQVSNRVFEALPSLTC